MSSWQDCRLEPCQEYPKRWCRGCWSPSGPKYTRPAQCSLISPGGWSQTCVLAIVLWMCLPSARHRSRQVKSRLSTIFLCSTSAFWAIFWQSSFSFFWIGLLNFLYSRPLIKFSSLLKKGFNSWTTGAGLEDSKPKVFFWHPLDGFRKWKTLHDRLCRNFSTLLRRCSLCSLWECIGIFLEEYSKDCLAWSMVLRVLNTVVECLVILMEEVPQK